MATPLPQQRPPSSTGPAPRRLLDQLRQTARHRGHAEPAVAAFADWSRRFILFHHLRHPRAMHALAGGLSVWALTLLPAVAGAGPPADNAPLAVKVHAVLETHCHRCHGKGGAAKGGFGFALDRDRLVARGLVVPGNLAESEL